jgi:predicted ATP-grasp superfamily ATP-dependent carboligase
MQNFLNQHFQLLPSFDETLMFLEKDKQLPLAKQAGFLVPKSTKLTTKSDLEIVIDTFNFPIIVKPLARHTVGIFDHKGLIVESLDKINELVGKYLDNPPTVLIAQEYIKGTDNDILFFICSSDQDGNVRAFVTGRKLRQNPPSNGMMACGYIEQLPDLEAKAKMLCKLYKINGFIGIECKRPPETNDYYYIETSFRPEIFNEIAEYAGVNLVYDTYASKLGQPCTIKKTADKGSWYDLFADLESIQTQVKQKKITWYTMLKKLPRPISYSHFALDDPIPFFARLLAKIKTKIKRKRQ